MRIFQALLAAALVAASLSASADVAVTDAWVRGTVAAQKATGAFMRLTSTTDAKLVEARSPAAGMVEIHQMAMEGNVMRMGAVDSVVLPAGKPVELKPGGYHVMLMDLKGPLREGETVPLTLVIEEGGKRRNVEVKAVVRALSAGPPGAHKH